MENKLLPIGTVVEVFDVKTKAIIVGFRGIDTSNPNKVHDYICYPYPIGFTSRDFTILLDHKDISNICYLGYSDEEEVQFKNQLSAYVMNKDEGGNL